MVLRFIYLIVISMIISISPHDIFGLDSNYIFQTIIDIDDYNDDQSLDTLIGKSNLDMIFIPTKIIWGKDSIIHPNPFLYPKVDSTVFTYPNWANHKLSFMINKFNRDTITDIVFINHGRIQIDSVTSKDTVTSIILFGQCGLDTIPEINLSQIMPYQLFPYKARHLIHGQDWKNCTLRGAKHRTIYELEKIHDALLPPPFSKHGCPHCAEKSTIGMDIYPSPAINHVNIRLSGLEDGLYSIGIIDLAGLKLLNQDIVIKGNENEFIINTNNLTTGTYLVIIDKEEKTIYSKKFLIAK